MRGRRVGEIEGDVIFTAGLLIGGVLLFKHFFPGDDGQDSQDHQTIVTVTNTPGNVNPWSINYQYSLYGQAPNSYGLSFWQGVQQGAFGNLPVGVDPNFFQDANRSGVYNYAVAGEMIESAFGLIFSDEAQVNQAFSLLSTKADVSNVAAYIYFMHGDDLLTLLQHGKGVFTGLSNGTVANLITTVSQMPAQ